MSAKFWEIDGHDFNFELHPSLQMAKERLVTLCKSERGAVVLAGNTGCGKTHLARCLTKQGPSSEYKFINEIRLMSKLRAVFNNPDNLGENPVLAMCDSAKMLILDDLGMSHVRPESLSWIREQYWQLLDGREDKMTVITTNLTFEQLTIRLGKRATSRLFGLLGGETNLALNFADLFGVLDYRLTRGVFHE